MKDFTGERTAAESIQQILQSAQGEIAGFRIMCMYGFYFVHWGTWNMVGENSRFSQIRFWDGNLFIAKNAWDQNQLQSLLMLAMGD